MVRGFAATEDICGDLKFYSDSPITAEDVELKKAFSSYKLDAKHAPTFRDALLYGQILYNAKMYKAAGHAGGTKRMECRVYLSAFNHADTETILKAVDRAPW